MENLNLPEGYQSVMPYLILKNPEGFMAFTKNVFGALEKLKVMLQERVMHAEVSISGSVIMLSESTKEFEVQNAGLFVYVPNCDETYKLALAHGAESLMVPADQSYGRSAGVKDSFGNTWWITSVLTVPKM